jgi:four helix bundle protein
VGTIKSYKDLIVWQKAIELSIEIYRVTAKFPKEEIYGLTSQIRRASNSVSLNIAEGYGRNTTRNYINSLHIAQGSLREVESGLVLALRLGFLDNTDCDKTNSLIVEEFKMFNALINSLEEKLDSKLLV